MRRRNVTLLFLALFMAWNVLTYLFLSSRPGDKSGDRSSLDKNDAEDERSFELMLRLHKLEEDVKKQMVERDVLIKQLRHIQQRLTETSDRIVQQQQPKVQEPERGEVKQADGNPVKQISDVKHTDKPVLDVNPDKVVLPILVIACNRPSINANLDQLINKRPKGQEWRFPIIVSQDCGHNPTASVIKSYGDKVTHIQHPDLSDIKLTGKEAKFKGYFKIARHYKWALSQVFHHFNHSAVIIVEDDLNIAVDFYEYFAAGYRLLRSDPTLWCVSAWNDNGKKDMISDDSTLLYRTDFFPGLGWLLTRDTWLELEPKWPATFWDDWMRHPDQRKNRSCIRPEISRTNTFGKIGVSKGLFFEKHLKFIQLNEKFVPFTSNDLSYLIKENYDSKFVQAVYSAPTLTVSQVFGQHRPEESVVRVEYTDKNNFKQQAKQLGIMEDLKSGVPRAAYRGVVSFMRGGRRIYFAPPANWNGYDPTWN